jgi:hypothetical protein
MLIILFIQLGASDPDTPIWIAPDYAAETFQLSEETRSRGLQELEAADLVTVRRRALTTAETFTVRRFRNVYTINFDTFDQPAIVPERTPGEARKQRDAEHSFF